MKLPLIALVLGSVASSSFMLDDSYARMPRGALLLEEQRQLGSAPQVPFTNFSDAYVASALATSTNWTALGAVTPVKNQGEHGYCGTFGRVASAEGQYALRGPGLVSFSGEFPPKTQDTDEASLSTRFASVEPFAG